MAHPDKMLPVFAAHAVEHCTKTGNLAYRGVDELFKRFTEILSSCRAYSSRADSW